MRTAASTSSKKLRTRSPEVVGEAVVAGRTWSQMVKLTNGSRLVLRPVKEQDLDALISFHERLSSESVHNRFFGSRPHLSLSEARAFVTIDERRRMAFVLVDGERLVAVGRYEGLEDRKSAEVAFVVADDFQRHGLATVLLRVLGEYARGEGCQRFVAQFLAGNTAMRSVFASSGLAPIFEQNQGVTDVELDLEAIDVAPRRDPWFCNKKEAHL